MPLLGWCLLALSLLAAYSSGAVVNIQAAETAALSGGTESHVFLRYFWRGSCTALFMASVSACRADGRRSLRSLAALSAHQWRQLALAGVALFLNKAFFAFTSLSHAALYAVPARGSNPRTRRMLRPAPLLAPGSWLLAPRSA